MRNRWTICALLFFATTVNYMDRQVLGLLEPMLQQEFQWTKLEYGLVTSAFQWAYGIGFLVAGRLVDRYGVRRAFSWAVAFWSIAAMTHGLARSAVQLAAARAFLGLGESANFPGGVKAVANFFPKQERATATGIFNAGSNVGLMLTPLFVPAIAVAYGWRGAFVFTGGLGFVWLACWIIFYPKEPPSAGKYGPYSKIAGPPAHWKRMIGLRQTWAFAFGKMVTDPAWWFYLFWLGPILHDKFNLQITDFGWPLFAIYLLADVGSIGGGWLSSWLLSKGWTVNRSRKYVMLLCALAALPISFAATADSLWGAVLLIGLAAAAHQGWSANLFTMASDMFPAGQVGTVVGIGGFAGAVSGGLFQPVAGYLKDVTGHYQLPLIMIGGLYMVALVGIMVLVPDLEKANIEGEQE